MSDIGTLYHLNDERLKVRDDKAAFAVADGALRAAVLRFGNRGEEQLREANVHPARKKVLESLGDHWTGLTVFVDHPEVPMGQQYGRAVPTWPGGGSEELLWQRLGVERPAGGDAVFAVPDAVFVGPEPSALAHRLPDRVCRSRRPSACGRGPLLAVEPQCGAAPCMGQ